MKFRILMIFTAIVFLLSLNNYASAQIMADDIMFIKLGYIPYGVVSFDRGVTVDGAEFPDVEVNNIETKGFNFVIQTEYNLVLGIVMFGLGIEYQRVSADKFGSDTSEYDKFYNNFIIPMFTIKFSITREFYAGIGAAGKYLLLADTPELEGSTNQINIDREIDLWTNGVLGYNFEAGEGVYIALEGRFGYNVTNRQYKKIELQDSDGTKIASLEFSPDRAFDTAVYIGFGIRPMGPGY